MIDTEAPFVTRAADGTPERVSLRLDAAAGHIGIALGAGGMLEIERPRPRLTVRADGQLGLDRGAPERATFATEASLAALAALPAEAQRAALLQLAAAAIAARPAAAEGGAAPAMALLRDLLTAGHPGGGPLAAAVRGAGRTLRVEAPGAPPATLDAALRLLRALRFDAGQALSCAPRPAAPMLAAAVDAEHFLDIQEPSGHERMAAAARLRAWAATPARRRALRGAI